MIEFVFPVFLFYSRQAELDSLPAQGMIRQCGHIAGQHSVTERKAEKVFKEGGVGKDEAVVTNPHEERGITQFGL